MNQRHGANEPYLLFCDKFQEAIDPRKNEILHFLGQYFPEINAAEFWIKCENELPYRK